MDTLVGTWALDSWDCTLDGAPHGHPFGPDAQGLLVYTADGTMSAMLMRAHRKPFAHGHFATATDAEKLAAADGFIAYGGTWELDGALVRHHVSYALLPNWLGTTLVRERSFVAGDGPPKLLLTTLPERTRAGKTVINRLLWHRVQR
jgi:hypothetical protein